MKKEKNSFYSHLLMGAGLTLLVFGAIYFYYLYETFYPNTENAYVGANLINVAPRVGGYIEHVYINNNQQVKKGELLVKINPIDLSLKLKETKENLSAAKQEAAYALEQIANARSNQQKAESNFHYSHQLATRYTNLYHLKADSLQNMQKYVNQDNQARQALAEANTALKQSSTQYEIAQSKITTAKIAIQNATVNQNYTLLFAPTDGHVANLNLQAGQLVMAGEKLFGLVAESSWWVDANLKETQLERIKPGQEATVQLDMYSHHYTGKVQSISYASGNTFSLLPSENASGNWVKVSQYFTVRIAIKNDPEYPLRVGASAFVKIHTLK
jgi:membrane fusion protein (multidrug efflux system)